MRRALLLALLLAPLVVGQGHAQSRGARSGVPGVSWTCGREGIPAVPVLCIEAPEPGFRRYVTDVVAQSEAETATAFQLYHGTSVASGGVSDCSTDQVMFLPPGSVVRFVAAGDVTPPTHLRFRPALIVPSGRDMCMSAIGKTAVISVDVVGYVAP